MFEKVLDKRTSKVSATTEAQAGEIRGRSSIDQIFILKSVVHQRI